MTTLGAPSGALTSKRGGAPRCARRFPCRRALRLGIGRSCGRACRCWPAATKAARAAGRERVPARSSDSDPTGSQPYGHRAAEVDLGDSGLAPLVCHVHAPGRAGRVNAEPSAGRHRPRCLRRRAGSGRGRHADTGRAHAGPRNADDCRSTGLVDPGVADAYTGRAHPDAGAGRRPACRPRAGIDGHGRAAQARDRAVASGSPRAMPDSMLIESSCKTCESPPGLRLLHHVDQVVALESRAVVNAAAIGGTRRRPCRDGCNRRAARDDGADGRRAGAGLLLSDRGLLLRAVAACCCAVAACCCAVAACCCCRLPCSPRPPGVAPTFRRSRRAGSCAAPRRPRRPASGARRRSAGRLAASVEAQRRIGRDVRQAQQRQRHRDGELLGGFAGSSRLL